MKRILLMVAILISNIAFSQEFEVISQSTKDCNCKENGRLISTGYSNTSGSLHQNGANDNDWKITSYPNGTGTINTIVKNPGFPLWAAASNTEQWIMPATGTKFPSNSDQLLTPGSNFENGVYVYSHSITVPSGQEAVLKISKLGGDNDLKLFINSSKVYDQGQIGGWGFKEENIILKKCLQFRLTAGQYTISAEINNISGPTGFYLGGCYDLVKVDPVCKCPLGWVSNTTQKEGDITKDGKCKKMVCGPIDIKPLPKNGTEIGNWGFIWGNGIWVWGTKENGGAPVCK
ncbi:MAG: hypothetical protein IPH28_00915 [Cytophagaceae bacterium]|nr:hypothetical protein [Cytophagaceae bacterium]